jgi:hypothetical protein
MIPTSVLEAPRARARGEVDRELADASGAGWNASETTFVVQHSPPPELTVAKRSGAGDAPLRTQTAVTAPAPRGT